MDTTNTTINAPYDSRLGTITEGLKLFARSELGEWLRLNRMELEGAIKRAIGKEFDLADWQKRPEHFGSSRDPRPKPETFAVEHYTVIDGKQTIRLRRGQNSRSVDYMDAAKEYIRDADKWLNESMQGFVDRMRDQARRVKSGRDREAEQEAARALSEAKAVIRADSEQDPRVRRARVSVNAQYQAKVERAAKLVELEAQSRKSKKSFAQEYAEAKAARLI